jgi:hypothetical protein
LRGHGGLDDVGVLPSGFVENPEVVVYQDCFFAGFFGRWFVLSQSALMKGKGGTSLNNQITTPRRTKGKRGTSLNNQITTPRRTKLFNYSRTSPKIRSGYAFPVIVSSLFVKVWRIEDDEVGLFF